MLPDPNDDFSTPPGSPHLTPSTDPSATSASPYLQLPSELMRLDTYDSSNNNVNQIVKKLQALEKMKDDFDESYCLRQEQLFNAIEKCELDAAQEPQNNLLTALKKWTKIDRQKPKIGENLQSLRKLIHDSQAPPKKVCKWKPPPKVKYRNHILNSQQQYLNGSECSRAPNAVMCDMDSEMLADFIQQKVERQDIPAIGQQEIDQLRLQLARRRKPDIEKALKTTNDETNRRFMAALLQQGETYQALQKTMLAAEDNAFQEISPNGPTMPTPPEQHDTLFSPPPTFPSLQRPNYFPVITPTAKVKYTYDDHSTHIERRYIKPRISQNVPTISSSQQGSLSLIPGVSPSYQYTPLPTLEVSSPKQDTPFLQKRICRLELDGGICEDIACESAHFSDYAKRL